MMPACEGMMTHAGHGGTPVNRGHTVRAAIKPRAALLQTMRLLWEMGIVRLREACRGNGERGRKHLDISVPLSWSRK